MLSNKQRKIKFRYIWQGPEKEIKKYEYTLEELEQKDVSYVIADYEASGWKLLGKLQYTGLKDKNRKEIYEGDILKVKKFIIPNSDTFEEGIGEVIFKNGAFSCDDWFILTCIPNMAEVEVIGDIYQNKNLIKENQND